MRGGGPIRVALLLALVLGGAEAAGAQVSAEAGAQVNAEAGAQVNAEAGSQRASGTPRAYGDDAADRPGSAAARFLLGAAVAFAAHEGAHVGTGLAFGGSPGVRRVTMGPIPFFSITHEPLSASGEYAVSSAGFWSQQLTSEVILGRHPRLRYEEAPFLKGALAFHLLLSAGYATAAFLEGGPVERDTYGMAVSARLAEPAIGGVILAPAAFDALRYFYPEKAWLKWAGRGSKLAGVLLLARTGAE